MVAAQELYKGPPLPLIFILFFLSATRSSIYPGQAPQPPSSPNSRMVNTTPQLASKDGHFVYPAAPRSDVTETTHGITVADPYRWLEDPEAEETKAYVDAQNALSTTYLSIFEGREKFKAR